MTVNDRLQRLEKLYQKKPLIVIAEKSNGDVVTVTAQDCATDPGLTFIRVVGGDNVNDVDLLLKQMKDNANEC